MAQDSDVGGADAPGAEFDLDVGAIAHGGHCVGRHEGRVVFVRHALPGEQVRARVTKTGSGKRFLFADAVAILRASPERVDPPCRYAGPGGCGGCDFQHVSVAEQRRLKAQVVREQLQRLGSVSAASLEGLVVEPVAGDRDGLRWRTRLSLAVDRQGRAGLHPYHSHEVLPMQDCLIATEAVVGSGALGGQFPGARGVDVVADDEGRVVVVPHPTKRRDVGVVRQHVVVGGWSAVFDMDPRAFWQVHPGAAAALVGAVLEGLAPQVGDRALDLYAGVGLFGRALADRVGPGGAVLMIESDPRAVAGATAWVQDVEHAEVRVDRVDRALAPLVAGGDRVDLVVLDPPRSGAGVELMRVLAGLRPRAIAYVACDPAALARDLAAVGEAGYRLESVRAFDQFPMTHHVECVALLTPC
ncbi:MAG: class I SAM-dependent RNA methyltransferase [Austwickia sp.]|nr:class I SAM-dependent RNA methyltransferase [Austwickia sp.]MBK8435527.1 class I SAM-dependent RNA methyltransferase [Austwickia sp.]